MRAIGDLASYMLSSRLQSDLRNSAETAAEAATTGLAKNKSRHLGGATMALSLLDRKAVLLEQHQRGIAEASLFAGAMQSTLGRIQDQTSQLVASLSLVSQVQHSSELKTLSETAAGVFVDTVNAVNSEIAGRSLFSGSVTRAQPLPNGQALLDMLRTDVAGAATVADVMTAIDTWFDAPGGTFETAAYQGSDTGFMTLPLSAGDTATFGLRADGETMRDLFKALAKGALAGDSGLGLDQGAQTRLLDQSRIDLLRSDRSLTEERSSLGLTEAIVEDARVTTDSELARLAIDRLSLIGVDQFEAASEFEAAQQQLEVFYRIAARQSRTSLAEYLR